MSQRVSLLSYHPVIPQNLLRSRYNFADMELVAENACAGQTVTLTDDVGARAMVTDCAVTVGGLNTFRNSVVIDFVGNSTSQVDARVFNLTGLDAIDGSLYLDVAKYQRNDWSLVVASDTLRKIGGKISIEGRSNSGGVIKGFALC